MQQNRNLQLRTRSRLTLSTGFVLLLKDAEGGKSFPSLYSP